MLDDVTRLKHMRDAAQEAIAFLDGHDCQDLEANRLVLLAVVKDIEIIGEAANQLSSNCRAQAAHLPWQEIIGMRNRLVHPILRLMSRLCGPSSPKICHRCCPI